MKQQGNEIAIIRSNNIMVSLCVCAHPSNSTIVLVAPFSLIEVIQTSDQPIFAVYYQ